VNGIGAGRFARDGSLPVVSPGAAYHASPAATQAETGATSAGQEDTMSGMTTERPPSPAVDRALTILETLVASDTPLTLTALATAAGVPLASCASIMQTLELRGYAARRVVGRSHFWRPTLKLNGLAAELVRRVDLSALAQPYLRSLVDETQMAAHVGVLEGNLIIYAAKVGAPGMVQFNTYPGKTAPYNLTALGRAIAAYLPEQQLAPLVSRAVSGTGPGAKPVTAREVRSQLAVIRALGYAVEDEEEDAGIGCVAAPFFDAHRQVVGSIGVTGFVEQVRAEKLRKNADAVLRHSRELSRELAAGIDAPAP
jgi:DNA-binding IclR family transcriptional regulator